MNKSLDQKIHRILADPDCGEFILADAKDADMGFGLAAPGQSPEYHGHEARFRSLAEYRQLMRDITAQGHVDIMLMSASSSEVLTLRERIFDNSHVTPAIRANDTTDIWLATASDAAYPQQPARPFRTATIDHAQCGKLECDPDERRLGVDLGLYSVTFNNDTELDHQTLEAYKRFRLEAEAKGFRHFLEVFDPNAPQNPIDDTARFLSDHIARALAGVTERGRPLFLKIPYHGPQQMEMLASYDRTLIPGILGGSAGTTYDAFYQLAEAKKHGARVALYGRKINHSEHQLTFVEHLRLVADGQIDPADAVRRYHSELAKLNITPYRALDDDLKITVTASSYSGTTSVPVNGAKPQVNPAGSAGSAPAVSSNGSPPSLDEQRARLDRLFG